MTTATAQANSNLAFIKYRLAKLGRSDYKDDSGPKDLGGRTFCPGVSQYLAIQ